MIIFQTMNHTIRKTVLKASEIIKDGKFEIMEKDSCVNIVTSADIAVQKYLEKELTALIPQSAFMGEENAEKCSNAEYTWIVDPIDGTQNFARSMKQSAICVALKHNNVIEEAVVYNPFLDDMFYATKGHGSYLNGRKLNVSSKSFKDSILFTAMSLYDKSYAKTCSEVIMDAYMRCNDVRRFGTASLELCYIADGRGDLYFEYRLFPWDFAAASLILTEAGGIIGSPVKDTYSFEHACPVIAANNIENYIELEKTAGKYIKNVPYL